MDMATLFFLSSGLFLGWTLGANNMSSVFGTAIGTKMVSFKKAAFIASVFVILGAVISGQGVSETLEGLGKINTLPGAFMTALAAALKADVCQIYTDVSGVFTADPRVVKNARKIPQMSYEELLEMASLGSKVMQARSVEFAQKHNVVFEVRSSFNNEPGTIVKSESPSLEDVVISGVAIDRNQTKVTLSGLPDKPGTAAEIFRELGEAGIVVDMIVQNIGRGGKANLTFTVSKDDAKKAEKVLSEVCKSLEGCEVSVTGDIAKVSVIGTGMRSHSGVAAKFFQTLAENNINIQVITTSEIKISVGISLDEADLAANALHAAFALDK